MKRIYAEPGPRLLHHYTSSESATLIEGSQCLWATSLSAQIKDDTELSYGVNFLHEAARKVANEKGSVFKTMVLSRLSAMILCRRHWMFIACFCGDGDSNLHREKFGIRRFAVPFSARNALRCSDWRAQSWLQPVIYEPAIQRQAALDAVQAIASRLDLHVIEVGKHEPWMESVADICARDFAKVLLGLLVGFKHESFSQEKEWRLVFCPRFDLAGTAPTMADEDFSASVKILPYRHIVLRPFSILSS